MKDKEKFRAGAYGFTTLSDMLDQFMALSFNNGRKYYKNMLVVALMAWKQLYWKTLRVTRNKRIAVDLATMSVPIPPDCLRIIAVKIIDSCDHYQPLTYDPYKALRAAHGGCGCKACSCDQDLCSYKNGITYSTEDITLNGVTYQRVIKSRISQAGDMLREITEPYGEKTDLGQIQVVQRTRTEFVASLEMKPCGCIAATLENKQKCVDFGGCPVVCCSNQQCDDLEVRVQENARGRYKIDMEESGRIYLYDSSAARVEVSYISNGEETAEEVIIPEYCNEAMYAALYYGSIRFRATVSPYEKRQAKADVAFENQELYEFLNPIVVHEFMDLQHHFTKW